MKRIAFLFLTLSCGVFSCVKTPLITYFDSADSTKYSVLPANLPDISVIRPGDILAIAIGSLNQESNEILNYNNINRIPTTIYPGQMSQVGMGQPLGFLVDPQGRVEIPLIGTVTVGGVRLERAAQIIKAEVDKILKEPSVSVRFLNHRFSVLGEVNRPGVYNLLDDKTTLPEALAMAGDLTVFGNRQNIMVIRDFYGKREVIRLNIQNREIFAQPLYYLKDGDLIYVEPVEAKATFTDQRVQLAPLYISLATSAVSIIALITNILK